VLAVGSDTDIDLLDTKLVQTIDGGLLAVGRLDGIGPAEYTSITMLRGKIMVEGGQFNGDLADGAFIPRKIPEEILRGPAV
jgi:hypothetical protein